MKNFFFLTSLIFLCFSCQTYSEHELNEFDAKIKAWAEKKELALKRTESGLYYQYIEEGTGPYIKYTESVIVLFKGRLLNGTIFEIQKKPMAFAVKEMIIGWKEALMISKLNTKIQIIVPPQLGYGNHQLDKVPPNSTLFYEIEIVEIK